MGPLRSVSHALPVVFHFRLLNLQINILHIRALVKADAVVLFDTYGSADSRLHSVFLYHLEVNMFFYLFYWYYQIKCIFFILAQSQSERTWIAV